MVPTVERGFRPEVFCEMEIVGLKPSMESTSGFGIWPRNCRAKLERLSTYRLCPSAKTVSKARELFPEPETPVRQTNWLRWRVTSTDRRLCSRAPLMTRSEAGIMLLVEVSRLSYGMRWWFPSLGKQSAVTARYERAFSRWAGDTKNCRVPADMFNWRHSFCSLGT